MLIDEEICTEKNNTSILVRGQENSVSLKPDTRTDICDYRLASLKKDIKYYNKISSTPYLDQGLILCAVVTLSWDNAKQNYAIWG